MKIINKLADLNFLTIFLMVLISIVCSLFPRLAFSQAVKDGEGYEDLVLAVLADREILSAGIFAIEKDGEYYLPLNELANVYGIYVEARDRQASGFIFNEENDFSIDAINNTVTRNGKTFDLPPNSFIPANIDNSDIFLNLNAFSKVWPLSLEVNKESLLLKTVPSDDLPFALLMDREKRRQAFLNKEEVIEEDIYRPFLAQPYRLFSNPALSVSGSANYRDEEALDRFGLSVGGTQDLLYAQADYTANLSLVDGEFIEPEAIRLRFRRQNIHEGALPYGLEDVQWGDVGINNRDLIDTGASGRGVVFSTRREDYDRTFDSITIDGVATPGWETELYVNQQLIAFGEVRDDGIYEFEDVSVNFGTNNIKVVLYGPQGQIIEREEQYIFRRNLVRAGENLITGGIIDQGERLIEINDRDDFRVRGAAANIFGAHGLTDKLTLFASASLANNNVNRESVDERYVTAGAIASFKNFTTQAEAYKQLGGGSALDLRGATTFKGVNVTTQASFFQDFESRQAGVGDAAKEFEFDFDIRKTLSTVIGVIGLQGGVDYVRRENGQENTVYRTRESYTLGGIRFTNATNTNFTNGDHTLTRGSLASSTFLKKLLIRNTINYNLHPQAEISSANISFRYNRADEYSASVNLGHNFLNDSTTAGFLVSRDFDKFLGSAGVNWSSDNGLTLSLRANTSFAPLGEDGSYIASSNPLRAASPVTAFTFRDLDYDGVYTEGDEPVSGSRVLINGKPNRNETQENGFMYDINPSRQRAITIAADARSIEDPYLVPSNPGYEIYPRPGTIHKIALPLIETGAVDGTLRWSTGAPITGLDLELLGIDGEIAKKSTTGPDGYYTFERVVPGNYTIRAAPETGVNIPFKYVDLTPDDLFQFGVDITAVDIFADNNLAFDIELDRDGDMNLKNILSVAKGAKAKGDKTLKSYDRPKKKKTVNAPKEDKLLGDASLRNRILNLSPAAGDDGYTTLIEPKSGVEGSLINEDESKKLNTSSNMPKQSSADSKVTNVRIGTHPSKQRVVLDLSEKTKYNLDYDENSNSVFIDMPNASWSAEQNWTAQSPSSLVNNYTIEYAEQGVRMIMAVADGAKIGQSGLLGADQGKKDRLYVDIIK